MPEFPQVSWEMAAARRMARHHLIAPADQLRTVARSLCGVHAQVMSAAELSLGLRLNGSTSTNIKGLIGLDSELVKTYGPRGTVHLLAAEDLPWWVSALSALPDPGAGAPASMRMTPEQTTEVITAIKSALADSDLTVEELNDQVIARTGPWAADPVMPAFTGWWPRWRQAIPTAAWHGALCFGPNRGRKITYSTPARLLTSHPNDHADRQDHADHNDRRDHQHHGQIGSGLATLVRAYLHAYGPATSQQFAQWLAVPKTWTAQLFSRLPVEQVEFEGVSSWVNAGDTAFADEPARGLRLLPYFDAFQVGSHPRKHLFRGRAAELALGNGQAGVMPVMLIDDTVGGIWHLARTGKKLKITAQPLARLTKAHRRDLDEQVVRIGEILGGTAELRFDAIASGKHL